MRTTFGWLVLGSVMLLGACGGSKEADAGGGAAPTSAPAQAPSKAPEPIKTPPPAATTPPPKTPPKEIGPSTATPAAPAAATQATAEELAALKKNIADTSARAEHVDPRVKVEHILISFAGRGTAATRTKEQAESLAAQLFARIQKGENFSEFRGSSSDDPGPGIYTMVMGNPGQGEFLRTQMVAAFGDVGWRLKVGEFGVAAFDPAASKFGWHIIKRVE